MEKLRSVKFTACTLLFVFFQTTEIVFGQTDTLEQYYQSERSYILPKFEREHLPLNGNAVAMIPFREDNKFGFVDRNDPDKVLIPPTYDQVFAVYPEGAIVKKGAGYGLVDIENNLLIQPYFSNLYKEGSLYHGLLETTVRNLPEGYNKQVLNHYYDEEGRLLFEQRAHEQESFIGQDSLAWFRLGRTYYIWSRTGRLLKKIRDEPSREFIGISANLLVFGYIEFGSYRYRAFDLNDKEVFNLVTGAGLRGVYRLSSNLYGLLGTDANYFFSDSLGNRMLFGKFSNAVGFFNSDQNYFSEEYFDVWHSEKECAGVIDRNGNEILSFTYKYLGRAVDGVRYVLDSLGKRHFLNTKGEQQASIPDHLMISFEHQIRTLQEPVAFYDGLCLAKSFVDFIDTLENGELRHAIMQDSTYFLFFDQEGEIQLELPSSISFVGHFSEGLAPALNKDKKLGFINKQGQWVIEPKYELEVAGSYPLPYLVVPEFRGGFAYIKSFKGYIDRTGKEYFSGKRLRDSYNFSH